MSEVLRELVALLRLEPLGGDVFRGQSQDPGWSRIYGGQTIGQAMMAATLTVPGRVIHSLHAYFVRPGDIAKPVDYRVETVRDGGSFSVRRVVADQGGEPIFVMSASFQTPEKGMEHQFEMPEVPGPESLLSELDIARANIDKVPARYKDRIQRERPFEMRPVDQRDLLVTEKKLPCRHVWIKAAAELPDDLNLHRCLLAYASDWGLLATALRPHGMTVFSRDVQTASLDHAMWFHHDFRIDDWLLYATDSPSSSGGRGFTRGAFYSRDGRLVVSAVQEGLIRKVTAAG